MPRKKNSPWNIHIGEDTRITVNLTIQKLLNNPDQKELEFPSSYTNEERAYIHKRAIELNLKSKSRGKGANRFVTVYKKDESTIIHADPFVKLQSASRQAILSMIQKYPVNVRERQDLLPPTERERPINTEFTTETKPMGRLSSCIPQVPQLKTNMELLPFRKSLPVYNMRDEILNAINSNQVTVIAGETGSGKTTQIPQYIMEQCQQRNQSCRLICTQPRRLAAVSIAERVSSERDEKVGHTFGYQIRLESRVAPQTLLTFCTNGVLLRTLMGGDSVLATITHIIVDEIHERDRFCDFLLIALKDALIKFRSLKLILMSATLDTKIFSDYFALSNCTVVRIPGRLFDVDTYFLEDVMKMTGYMTKEMVAKKKELLKSKEKRQKLDSWKEDLQKPGNDSTGNRKSSLPAPILGQQNEPVPEKVELEPWLIDEMNKSMSDAWHYGKEENFTHLLHIILSENVSVDYQHTETTLTPLMVAAARGCENTTEQLLNLGANLNIRGCNEYTALDWAKAAKHTQIVELIEAYAKSFNVNTQDAGDIVRGQDCPISEEDRFLLDVYFHTFNDENIDYDLLSCVIQHIHLKMPAGSILVFLPGYDDIINMREKINAEEKKMNQGMRYTVFTLHSEMQTSDQKRVFKPSPPGTRKIIFSTNISETSITIDDVVYVVDTGKVKEKSYDAMAGVCSLRSNWISQACAKQRRGRAGRTQKGICYRLFSSIRYNSMQPYQTPEILRLPLQELCLYTKHLAPGNTPIAEFLERAIEPPSTVITRNAVQLLKTIDALDPWEDLTELGRHLLDLPIDPRLGKMLLYAVVLKCLDPILTIVCSLAYKDPFVLPSQPSQRRAAMAVRKKFSAGSYSDHMTVLRAFQQWQNARSNRYERSYCENNFVSSPVMEMVVGTRTQLLGQLRASGFVKARGPGDIRDLNTNSENWAVVKAALTAGLYPNLARVDREHRQLRTQKETKVSFHPSSTLRDIPKSPRTTPAQSHSSNVEGLPADWLVYEEMSRSGRYCHVKTTTLVNPITIAIMCGPARLPLEYLIEAEVRPESESDSESEENLIETTFLKLDDWVVFKFDRDVAQLVLHLRQKWNALFLRRMKTPGKPMSSPDEQVIKTLVTVLTAEEQACGLQQPQGIGQRPRPVLVDYYPANARKTDDSSCKSQRY